ncbi:ATP-binding protein [Micromonospora sp. KC207]|uniref:ATP-binding protein n=1 Tax=Micromonospora sp. KC207 TaxID=2530377 RepID=UPI0010522714|nr:ATP-binding protein [Micromonospora sp. KC207]TDC66085.1 ATP-binding protein [Micromonospora sp. KC207]
MTAPGTPPTSSPQAPAGISIISSRLRSTNIERDVRADHLGPLHVGIRAQDVLDRVTAALEDPGRTRAWSLTGPYGSGKSTLALVTTSLLGHAGSRRSEAEKLLTEASPILARRLTSARDKIAPNGFVTCVTTARREPLLASVARALLEGASRTWSDDIMPSAVRHALEPLATTGLGHQQLLSAVRTLCEQAPVLLVIDEFGKSLEHLAAHGDFSDASSDVFLLQELAELGAGACGVPLYLLTLQHLSFGDYASRSNTLLTREWAKIQGRFEDILMTVHLGDTVELVRRTLDHSGVTAKGRKLITEHAAASARAWTDRGLEGILAADQEFFAQVYPLHPLTTVVAPLLAAQIGQHDRSVTGFIANDEPHTARRFLASYATDKPTMASTIRIADAFDFFFTAGRTTVLASANASRWMEIDNRIAEAHGLPEHDQVILKTVGMLNLVDASGALRASMDTILFALADPTALDDTATRQQLADRVASLVERGFLVYRQFSDEYRVWQGSDVDLTAHIEQLIDSCDDHTAVRLISDYLPPAVVAGKHSQRTGMLRYFVTKATDSGTPRIEGPSAANAEDGVLLFHFGTHDTIPTVRTERPVVAGTTEHADKVLQAARYLHALNELPAHVELDGVASAEVKERIAQASAELATRVAEAFLPSQLAPKWYLMTVTAGAATWSPSSERVRGRSLAELVSKACDSVFPDAPHIRNEMLGRHKLTSQAAKARRELITAMINSPGLPNLGIEGYGPERAMYGGVLEYLRLHRLTPGRPDEAGHLTFGFCEPEPPTPAKKNSLYPAWTAMRQQMYAATEQPVRLDVVYSLLEAPPYGMRPGVIPIIVLTALIIGSQELALFEEGTYQTRLTDALAERMLKAPERFAVKAMGVQAGPRKIAVDEIAQEIGARMPAAPPANARNVAPLAITRQLLDRARTLSSYADRTQQIPKQAQAVRQALKTAREPDALLFTDLPAALGLKPIPADGPTDEQTARRYAASLSKALTDISRADARLRDQVVKAIAAAFHLPTNLSKLRERLAAYTQPLAEVNLVEAKLRGVIMLAQDTDLTDDEWLDPFVVRIVGRGLSDWRDGDITTFAVEARAVARSIERLASLHQASSPQPADSTFVSQTITLTQTDGQEFHAVVHLSDDERTNAQALLPELIALAREKIGENGERALLALLAENVIAERDTGNDGASRTRRKPTR